MQPGLCTCPSPCWSKRCTTPLMQPMVRHRSACTSSALMGVSPITGVPDPTSLTWRHGNRPLPPVCAPWQRQVRPASASSIERSAHALRASPIPPAGPCGTPLAHLQPRVIRQALLAAGLVGTLLVALNQGDIWGSGHVTGRILLKSLLTPLIPFGVTMLGAFLNSRPTVLIRLSSPGRHCTLISVEESSDDCKPTSVHCEFLQFYIH